MSSCVSVGSQSLEQCQDGFADAPRVYLFFFKGGYVSKVARPLEHLVLLLGGSSL